MQETITAEFLLNAYANGYFPMADSSHSAEIHWYSPEKRGILPLDSFHVPRSLHKFMRKCGYEVRFDTEFETVIRQCAQVRTSKREDSWINETIIDLYVNLAEKGFAKSVECWHENQLIGGLYGISLGKAFFGESMFSLKENASKFALVHLVQRLQASGFLLLDTQYINDHLLQFGVSEIPKKAYLLLLEKATQECFR